MAERSESISKVFKNIIRSPGDSRNYCGLELTNGMRVLLISDPTTDRSAAALDVRIGTFSDPTDLPGLAHLCEHMLFLGSAKYPAENDYDKFLKQHGGSSNAFTTAVNTCYHFDVAPSFLRDSLDRFAQFFLCPLFTESATEKEVNVIHSEHENDLQMDSLRLVQLEKATCNPKHVYSKFGTGNIETLWNIPKSKGISIREELLKFYEKYYSSNIMALVVLGKEPIEELTDYVVPLFSNVSNKNVKIPEWKDHPFDDHLKLRMFVVPVRDIRCLSISFPIPDLDHLYKSHPGRYLCYLISHEGSGSLVSELKLYGWVNQLVSGCRTGAKGFAFFDVDLDLTNEGLDHVNDIINHFFQYLALLKKAGPQKWIFEERKNLASMAFRFKGREHPQSYTCSLAGKMFDYPMEEILCGSHLLYDYEPKHIKDLLGMLTPETIRITVVGQKYKNMCDEVEKWYGTRFKLLPIPENVLNTWKDAKPHPNCKFPTPNEFLPNSFELVPREDVNPKYPQLIKNTAMGHLWFKQDDEFLLPKADLHFELESPVAYFDPLHYNMNHLFVELINDSLNEYAHAAQLAGLSYCLINTKIGIYLNINGYNDKLHVLLEKIMDRLTNFRIDEKRFNILKKDIYSHLKEFDVEEPEGHAEYYISLLLPERIWTNEELLNCIEEVTIENVQQMSLRLLSKIHIEALIHGNITKKQALSLMNIVESALEKNMSTKYLMPSQLIRNREVQLSDGHHYLYEALNDVYSCSAVQAYYQCGIQDRRSNMLLQLLCGMISEPCVNVLRTQEQLGDIVCSFARRSQGCAHGLAILVQSDKYPGYVDGRIEAFIQYLDRYIQDMSDEEFQNHIQSLIGVRLKKTNMLMQAAKFWLEITSRQYNFDRSNIEVATLRTITKEEIYAYYKELVAHDAPKRKKLSVHVKSSLCKSLDEITDDVQFHSTSEPKDGLIPPPPPPALEPPETIDDIIAFKQRLGLYPLVAPCIRIPPPPYVIPERLEL